MSKRNITIWNNFKTMISPDIQTQQNTTEMFGLLTCNKTNTQWKTGHQKLVEIVWVDKNNLTESSQSAKHLVPNKEWRLKNALYRI